MSRLAVIRGFGHVLFYLTLCSQTYGQRFQALQEFRATNSSIAVAQARVDLTFEAIRDAQSRGSYEITQLRWVRDGSPQARFVGVREKLMHDVGPDGIERISVEPQSVSSQPPADPDLFMRQEMLRQDLYRSRAGYIFFYQSFRVHDAGQAAANYKILPIVRTGRLGRPVDRVLVYPVRWDRSIWLLDIDIETSYPLVCREFNNQAQLLSELVVEQFRPGPLQGSPQWWNPTSVLSQPMDALVSGGRVLELGAADLPPGYEKSRSEVVESLLTGEMSYVSTFTDGVDNLFLIQTGVDDRGSILDMLGFGRGTESHTIFEYTDLNVAQYFFFARDSRFQLLGRSSVQDLRPVLKRIYLRALR